LGKDCPADAVCFHAQQCVEKYLKAPLVTQFGGGKTHTLTALYHIINSRKAAMRFTGVPELLESAKLDEVPQSRVAVFVGNA